MESESPNYCNIGGAHNGRFEIVGTRADGGAPGQNALGDREAFIKKYDAIPFKNYGANIKEHVEVPDALLRKPEELGPYLEKSRVYTESLPPKAGKKKSK